MEALQFQPSSIFDDGELTAVTTGDKIFKLWILEPPTEGIQIQLFILVRETPSKFNPKVFCSKYNHIKFLQEKRRDIGTSIKRETIAP